MTPEARLLLQCARPRPAPGDLDRLACGVGDWPALLALAGRHDLQPCCFWHLDRCCPERVPPEVLGCLRQRFRDSTAHNLLLTGELFRILETLGDAGVPAAVWKGPVWAWGSYETPALREYLDLDLLVRAPDVSAVERLLASSGYRPEPRLPERVRARLVENCGQMVLVRDHPKSILDLHWDLAPRSLALRLSAGELWPRLRPVPIAGREVLSFDAGDQLLLAAWHGGKHGWTTLAWLADMAALLDRHPVAWDRVLADARRMRLERSLWVGLRLLRDLLDTPLPRELVAQMVRDRASESLAREAAAHLVDPGPPEDPFFPRPLAYQLRLTTGWSRRLRVLWRNLCEPELADWEALRIGPSFSGSYYLARPLRLAGKYLRRAASRFSTGARSAP